MLRTAGRHLRPPSSDPDRVPLAPGPAPCRRAPKPRKAKNEDFCGSISRCKLALSFPLRRFVAGVNCDPGLL